MSRARDHISDILEQNQKKADEIAEKKRKKEEQKQRREEREAIRKRKLVLKRVLVPVTQAGDGALDEVPCDPIDEGSLDEAYLVGVQKYVMTTEVTTPTKIRSLLNLKA